MSQDNIFREVDEELRSERMRKVWRRYGPFVIGAAVAVVLAVAVNEGWAWWQSSNAAKASDEFYAALEIKDGGDTAAAQAALEAIAARGGGYGQLARFAQAGVLTKEGKTAEAIAAYDALGASEGNVRLRELAFVLGANLLVDAGDVAGVQQRVGGLVTPDNPMRNAAQEIIGLVQYKAGDLAAARTSFETVMIDPAASTDMRTRMQIYLAQLAAEGALPPETEAPADAAAPAADAAPMTEATPPAEASPMVEAAPEATAPAAEPAADVAPAAAPAPATDAPASN